MPRMMSVAVATVLLLIARGADAQPVRGQPTDLRVSFVDVGQGDAIWIKTPEVNGVSKNIIVDGGPDRLPKNRLVKFLETYRLPPGSIIDYAIATHPHDDHYPGLLDVLALYQVRTIVHSGFPGGQEYQAFLRAAAAETVNGRPADVIDLRLRPDFTMDWGGRVTARLIYTDKASATDMGSRNTRANNASMVIRVDFDAISFLLMGDAEGKGRNQPESTARYVEGELLRRFQPNDLHVTVLKAGHHGSETGSTLPFLKAVHPDVVVVMSGRRPYGGSFIPDETVLERYAEVNPQVMIVRTDEEDVAEQRTAQNDQDGDDIYMRTDGRTLRVYQAVGPDRHRRWRLVEPPPG